MKPASTICIFFSDTGGGHRAASDALKAGLERIVENELSNDVDIRVVSRPIIEQSHPINRFLVDIYSHLARHNPTWIKYYYQFVNFTQLESNMYRGLFRSYAHRLLKAYQPSLVVSVHPMLAHALIQFLEEVNLRSTTKVAVVVTDPNENLWHAWACKKVDIVIAPNEIVRNCLIRWGITPDKIQVLGMPIHPKFLSPSTATRSKFLTRFGLSSNIFTLCINTGWAGNAHLLKTYRALYLCRRRTQVIILSGYNRHLYEAALLTGREIGIPTVVLPFYDKMPDLMSSVDAMVTKAGGLTAYQAVARRLPLILDNTIEPMPQEAPTMKMLVKAGLAISLNDPNDIAAIVDNMEILPQREKPLPTDYQLDLTDHAIYDISKTLLQLSHPTAHTVDSVHNVA